MAGLLFDDGKAARFSDDGLYRYWLKRGANPCAEGVVNFIMLNPSTADAERDDPTIRRCFGYARSWGYGDLVVTNLFAFRATDPDLLASVADPIGPENDRWILEQARLASAVVCAWGAIDGYRWARHGTAAGRDRAIRAMLVAAGIRPRALRLTTKGHPWHPLYCPSEIETVEFDNSPPP